MRWKYEDEALKKLERDGMRPSRAGGQAQRQLEAAARECRKWVYPWLRGKPYKDLPFVSLVYIYHFVQTEQKCTCFDGICHIFDDNSAAIGVVDEILLGREYDYQLLVFIHELCHLSHMSHNEEFVTYLNGILAEFNQATGRHLVNDQAVIEEHKAAAKRFNADWRTDAGTVRII